MASKTCELCRIFFCARCSAQNKLLVNYQQMSIEESFRYVSKHFVTPKVLIMFVKAPCVIFSFAKERMKVSEIILAFFNSCKYILKRNQTKISNFRLDLVFNMNSFRNESWQNLYRKAQTHIGISHGNHLMKNYLNKNISLNCLIRQ